MSEVQSRACVPLLEAARRRGIPVERLVDPAVVSRDVLLHPRGRIPWEVYVALLTRLEEALGGPTALDEVGAEVMDAPLFGPLANIGMLFASPIQLYRLGWRWFGPSLLPHLRFGYEKLGRRRVRLTVEIPEPDSDSPQFFRITRACLMAAPRLIGRRGSAEVSAEVAPRRAVYIVDLPARTPLRVRASRAWRGAFNARRAIAVLEEQQAELKQTLDELVCAHERIREQAAQLELLNTLGRDLARHLELAEVADSLVSLLRERLNYCGVELWVVEPESGELTLSRRAGDVGAGRPWAFPLSSGERRIGRLEVWSAPGKGLERSDRVLEQLVPWVTVAIEQAHAFEALRRHKELLEREVEERKRVEARLRASEASYRSLVEQASDAIFLADENGRIVEANPRACELFGYTREELLGKYALDLVADRRVDTVRPILDRLGDQLWAGRPIVTECAARRKDGSKMQVEVSARLRAEGVQASVRDLTERRRAEEQRRVAEASRLERRRLESLGILAGGIAHDFNNLLTSVLGNAGLMKMALPPGSPIAEPAERIEGAAHKGAYLTRQLLAYAGKAHVNLARLDLSAVVRDALERLRDTLEPSLGLHVDLQEGLPPVELDPGQITQVVFNLLTNAAEAVDEAGGEVGIRTFREPCDSEAADDVVATPSIEGECVGLEVWDSGAGIDPEVCRRMFEPFYTTKFPGRGLGLAAVLGIVRMHGGALRVRSAPGRGTAVWVGLPLARPATAADEPAAGGMAAMGQVQPAGPAASAPAPPAPGGAPERQAAILVIDHEEQVREVARAILVAAGYRVRAAASGAEAVASLKAGEDVSAAILDVTMPGQSGEDALRALRDVRPGLPVLLSSGYLEETVAGRFQGMEVAGFVPKPYEPAELVQAVEAMLTRAAREPRAAPPDKRRPPSRPEPRRPEAPGAT